MRPAPSRTPTPPAPAPAGAASARQPGRIGVRIAGTGSFLPERRLTNADLEKVMETNNEWILQRTGIHERRITDKPRESTAMPLGRRNCPGSVPKPPHALRKRPSSENFCTRSL